jgi:asparagine synthase (glutamine-hydrolysing)
MCGIAGIVRCGGLSPEDLRGSATLADYLHHRGPDAHGVYTDSVCHITQTRLAVRGPKDTPQPVRSSDGRYVLAYNGEVYNVDPANDTEAVFDAWMRQGPDCLRAFNGMFALFVWDRLTQTAWAAVDPLGVKPLLYSCNDERLLFGSEAGALIASGLLPFRADEEALAEYLTAPYFSGARRLPFQDLHRIPPGHWLAYTRGKLTLHRYFTFRHQPGAVSLDALAEAVQNAGRAAMIADSPPGIFLSGGIDSSLMAASARQAAGHSLRAWTIDYEGQHDYTDSLIVKSDDVPYASRVAASLGLTHEVVRVRASAYSDAMRQALWTNDLISAWEQEVSQYQLAAAASRECKAVLVGDAADETHYGYSFLLDPARIASPVRMLDFFGTVPLRHLDARSHFSGEYMRLAESLGYSWKTEDDQRLAISCLILHYWLVRLLHNGDIHTMAHGLEGRVPYADARLLELAQGVPVSLGLKDGIEKWHLRKVAERFIDAGIAWRPKSALTKSLAARGVIHQSFVNAWKQRGEQIAHIVDPDGVCRMTMHPPEDDRATGLRFRILALLTWFERWGG